MSEDQTNWRSAMLHMLRRATFDDLVRFSIRTGCETTLNSLADNELRNRGYVFDGPQYRWIPYSQTSISF